MCDRHESLDPLMQPDKKPTVPRTNEEKQKIINRLKRVEGQVRGIQKMVEEDRYCVDILIQLSAIQAALKKVGFSILERHTKTCVADAIKEGQGDHHIQELISVIKQFNK
ncbi:metal-sensing transcriptional repressor [Terrilactibacillus laevilacticus]|uniref:Metal-sensing transcriptional repressor n=1 Tax=Terrilactibacillus laevilacticus TaxID=1380157 RepID=A0ABW5PSR3_9BACI|nr:metal-sensing transcriptional repressor [Terrilactibacillus laevilacticus]